MKFIQVLVLAVCGTAVLATAEEVEAGENGRAEAGPVTNHGEPAINFAEVKLIFFGNWTGGWNKKGRSRDPITNFRRLVSSKKILNNWWTPVWETCGRVGKPSFSGDIVRSNPWPKKTFKPADVYNYVIKNALSSGPDSNYVYIVIASGEVKVEGMCDKFCGFHGNSGKIAYGFVGVPTSPKCKCVPQQVSPSGDYAMDATLNTLVNVLTNTVTNPYGNGWYAEQGTGKVEYADMCADTFPNESTAPNGAKYNVEFGNAKYYIQGSWDAQAQKCII